MAVLSVVQLLFWLYGLSISHCLDCDTVLRADPLVGIGIFAYRELEPTQIVETAIGIPIPMNTVFWTQLVNYIEGYNDTHALLSLGNSMLYNHVINPDHSMLRKHMTYSDGILQFREPFQSSIDILFEVHYEISRNEQIYSHYGEDWFFNRGREQLNVVDEMGLPVPQLPNEAITLPGCSHIYATVINNKLVATRFIPAGTIIEVVRALLIPDWAIIQDSLLVDFMWWRRTNSSQNWIDTNKAKRKAIRPLLQSPYLVAPWNRSTSAYAVVLTGHGALYSHNRLIDTTFHRDSRYYIPLHIQNTNVQYDWYTEIEGVNTDLLKLVSFTAITDINPDDELVVDIELDPITHRRFVREDFATCCL